MKLHEFQAKRLFAHHGIPTPRHIVVSAARQAGPAYTKLKRLCGSLRTFRCAVKAQIHAGGRGKAGGVILVTSAAEAKQAAARLIGSTLVTHQTGPEGLPVRKVLIEESMPFGRQLYAAITIDRSLERPVLVLSREGGVDIETVAKDHPDAILKEPIDPAIGLRDFQLRRIGAALAVAEPLRKQLSLLRALYQCFLASDASLVEINPLVETNDGRLLALDAKIVLDDNGLIRRPELAKLRDRTQEHPLEYQASQVGISYVGLDGTIGCLVNGAGLAMATNDIIKLHGGSPANFLDVGGGANVEQVTRAFKIILADARVRAILVNIFGGIMRCDWVAQGLINAAKEMHVRVPLVVRLQGTNVEEGRRMLAASGLAMQSADELDAAAKQVVELARDGAQGTGHGARHA